MTAGAMASLGAPRRAARVGTARLCGIALVLLLGMLGRAGADAALGSAGHRPWQVGVSAEQRARAEQEFLAGNSRFEQSDYAGAAVHYRAALATWQHPSIQFNLAVCLINLDKPVEAYDQLQGSLRFGRDGLRDHFDEANNYARLLLGRISTLEIAIPPGAQVTLDGAPVVGEAGAARVTLRLAPGRHSLVARKAEFELWSKDLVLVPGETAREVIELRAPRTRTVRRWSTRLPWWTLAGGALLAGVGAASFRYGSERHEDVIAQSRACAEFVGCSNAAELRRREDRALRYRNAGLAGLAVGATAVVTGVVLLVLNQPRQVLERPGVAVQLSDHHLGLGWTHAF
jgi:hypothetical protein